LYEEVKIFDESKKQHPIFESAEGVFFKKLTFSTASLGRTGMDDIRAKSPSELLAILKARNISVPPRTEGRTKEHCERWSICRLLSTLAARNLIQYPVHLHHQDKPDFRMQTGRDIVGIEVTEAIPQDYAAATALSEKENPDAVIDMSLFKWGGQSKTVDELREIISQKKLTGPGWEGDTPEGEWGEAITQVLETKHLRLVSPDFQMASTNWLQIYDNLPLSNPDPILSLNSLFPNLRSYWSRSPRFDTIYVDSGEEIFRLTVSGWDRWSVNNLWKSS
jgi:hypothetical protein